MGGQPTYFDGDHGRARAGGAGGETIDVRDPLTVLVVGTDDWAVEQAGASLRAAGLRVLGCHQPGEPPFPCNAFLPGRRCPIDEGVDVVLDVRARPARELEPGEVGVVCGLRARAPLAVAGATGHHPFEPLAPIVVAEGGDVVSACRLAIDQSRRSSSTPRR